MTAAVGSGAQLEDGPLYELQQGRQDERAVLPS
jgi:hypothetical protein